jgi:hypothetical protein
MVVSPRPRRRVIARGHKVTSKFTAEAKPFVAHRGSIDKSAVVENPKLARIKGSGLKQRD